VSDKWSSSKFLLPLLVVSSLVVQYTGICPLFSSLHTGIKWKPEDYIKAN